MHVLLLALIAVGDVRFKGTARTVALVRVAAHAAAGNAACYPALLVDVTNFLLDGQGRDLVHPNRPAHGRDQVHLQVLKELLALVEALEAHRAGERSRITDKKKRRVFFT